jgi:GH3 auxin-responsive promoter
MQTVARFLVSLHLRRKRAEARRFLARTTAEPERFQEQALRRILSANQQTTYGQEHLFRKIKTPREFQEAVPINSYEELRPYVDRIADGSDPHALTADPVEMFTNTSGTTSKPKLIPVTASGRRAERRVKDAWLANLVGDYPSILRGKWFYLFNNAHEYQTPSGLWVGSNAGLMYQNTPWVVRSLQAMPYEICLIEEYESRYYVILRHLLACDLSLMICINPSSILLLAELIQQHAEALIKDIYTGGLRDGLALTEAQYAFFRARLPAKPNRARALARHLAADSRLLPSKYWPRLKVLNSWKGPGVNAFIEKCRAWYGDVPSRDVGYGSSEFRTGLVLSDEGSQNIPLPDNYFYEFIPEADREAYLGGGKRPLLLHELEEGSQYLIVQTGAHGLYRYNIEDIVQVNGSYGRTPTIQFVQKARMVTSITGEKLYETQVIDAMARISARRPELEPSFFVCYADVDAANYKLCVEYDEPRSSEQLRELLGLFEEALGEVNIEYPYKRASMRLKDPEIFALPSGTSVRLIQHLGRNAVMDNQVKIPRLSRDIDAHFQVFGLDPRRTTVS